MKRLSLVLVVMALVALVVMCQLLRQGLAYRQQQDAHPVQTEVERVFSTRFKGAVRLDLQQEERGTTVRLAATSEVGPDERLARELGHWLWRRLAPELEVLRVLIHLKHPEGGPDLERVVQRPPFLKPTAGGKGRVPG